MPFRQVVICIIVALSCVSLVSCASRRHQKEAEEIAEGVFQIIPEMRGQGRWGTDVRVFGRGEGELTLGGLVGAGSVSSVKKSDSPETFEITIPFWCTGRDQTKRRFKLRREFHAIVFRPTPTSGLQLKSFSYQNDKPLSLLRQMLHFLGWGMIAPIICLYRIHETGFEGIWGWSGFPILLLALSLALIFYFGYVCFGSFVEAGVAASVFVVALLLIIFRNR